MNDLSHFRKVSEVTLEPDDFIAAAFASQPRRLMSWSDEAIQYDPKAPDENSMALSREDNLYMDECCALIHDLPTVQGLLAVCPEVAEADLYKSFIEDEPAIGIAYENEIDMNALGQVRKGYSHDDAIIGNLPHELRHIFQKKMGCMEIRSAEMFRNAFKRQLMFNRVIEADATVFSVVVGYEALLLKDDSRLLNGVTALGRGMQVNRYMREAMDNPKAHWNGNAARSAFETYFDRRNKGLLNVYDAAACERFMRGVKVEEPEETPAMEDVFQFYVDPMTRMPYVDENGDLKERRNYLSPWPLAPREMIKGLSRETRQMLQWARDGEIALEL